MYSPTQPGMDTSSVGVANVQALTLFDHEPATPPYPIEAMLMDGGSGVAATSLNAAAGAHPVGGNPVWVILGGVFLIVILGWIRKQSSEVEGQTIAFNAFNFLVLILVTMIGFVIAKTLVTIFPIPGITPFVHAA